MSIIDRLLSKTKVYRDLQTTVKSLSTLSNIVYYNSGTGMLPNWRQHKETDLYCKMDDLYSIVSLVFETAATIPLYGYSVEDERAMKSYTRKGQLSIHGNVYRTKAMQDLPESDPLAKFLESMTYEELIRHYATECIYGEDICFIETIDIGPNRGNVKLWPLDPYFVTVYVSETFPQTIIKYRYSDGKFDIDFKPEDIFHSKFHNPANKWRGLAPFTPLAKIIDRNEAGKAASVAQLQNGGVPGVVFMKNATADPVTDGKFKDDLAAFLSNSDNKGAPYTTSFEVGYIPWGLKLAYMEVAQLADVDFIKMANVFKVPVQLLNNTDASTDNNMQWAEKRLYTNSILPLVYRLRDELIRSVLPKFGTTKRRHIEADISGVSALQEDLQKQAQALDTMWWVAPNLKLEAQGFPKSDDPIMDQIIIPSGHMLLSDLSAPPDLNLTDGQDQPANSRQGNQQN